MPEKQRRILEKLGDKYPCMTDHQKGFLEGVVSTAAAMSTLTDQQPKSDEGKENK